MGTLLFNRVLNGVLNGISTSTCSIPRRFDSQPYGSHMEIWTEALVTSPQGVSEAVYDVLRPDSMYSSKHLEEIILPFSCSAEQNFELPTTPWKVEACGPCRQGRLEFKMEKSCGHQMDCHDQSSIELRSAVNPIPKAIQRSSVKVFNTVESQFSHV